MLRLNNNQSVNLDDIAILNYSKFSSHAIDLLSRESCHCVAYFAYKQELGLHFIMAIADDDTHDIILLSHLLENGQKKEFDALSQTIFALHIFERELHENFDIDFKNHPWLKPVRYPQNRANQALQINDYPFYSIESTELHEVGVGPIHAGIIEPGHFRFICNGEKVLHLEIQLGYQHRGVEQLFIDKTQNLQRNLLAENIAGDTVIGHTNTFVQIIESLSAKNASERIQMERALALELERIAIHTGDVSALCTDAAYLLGASVFGTLRTLIINFLQHWCGNRFGKGLIRIGGTHFPFNDELKQELRTVLSAFETQFEEMVRLAYRLPSIQNRFDFTGILTKKQAQLLGIVGISARMCDLVRDIRESHPNLPYQKFPYKTLTVTKGDVFARFLLKKLDIRNSIAWIRKVLDNYTFENSNTEKPQYNLALKPHHFAISLTEAWRGEICHCAITDNHGGLQHYKVTDPSLHNWKALEISMRNMELSDFPINNKSYNLSFCGHDL